MAMSLARRRESMGWEACLAWEADQPERYELVDGEVYAMTGGTLAHDTIANSLRAELRERLRGGSCRPHGPDLKVKAGANGRYPDALIDCGPWMPEAVVAQEPVVVFAVLSRSTAWVDQSLKLRDYDAMPGVRSYVLVSQDEPRVLVHRRDGNGRLSSAAMLLVEGLDAVVELPEPGISLPLAGIYEGIEFAGDRAA
ncbi:MAG: Uma2 family endonuclease [Gluconacetobacter diazotrophicus]|nr:Uma2 family endonuclease [Gluconacetobacter diazotrophicus]